MPVELNRLMPKVRVQHILAAWICYLARITGESNYPMGWVTSQSVLGEASVPTSFSPVIPINVSIDLDWNMKKVRRNVSRECRNIARNYTYFRDATLRNITLGGSGNLLPSHSWQIAIFVGEDEPDEGTNISALVEVLTLQIRPCDGRYRWIYDQNKVGSLEIDRIATHLEQLVNVSIDPIGSRKPVGM
ncbi:hypothetical protein, partial [Rhizobium sp. YK2]|uniref:hypothetical protein n=1 Tax=Rhizobium sp. YK2 TaxID=1860096 RepID=UPI001AECBE6F